MAKMLHRDVSVNNIMYEVRGGKYYFILIDFDMAVTVAEDGEEFTYVTSSRHRTGTLPFMAYELVRDAADAAMDKNWVPIKHRLRHDWASLFFISVWCVCQLTDGLTRDQADALQTHATLMESGKSLADLANRKKEFCTTSVNRTTSHSFVLPPVAQQLMDWFDGWTFLFSMAVSDATAYDGKCTFNRHMGNVPEPFDHETAGGWFTRKVLKDTLTPRMPFQQPLHGESPANSCAVDIVDAAIQESKEFAGSVVEPAEDAPIAAPPKAESRVQTRRVVKEATAAIAPEPIPKTRKKAMTGRNRRPTATAPRAASQAITKTRTKHIRQPPIPVVNDMRSRLRPRKVVNYKT